MEADIQICIRLKRQKTTYFITISAYEQIDSLKRKLLSFYKGLQLGDVRLYYEKKLIDQKSNAHDQGIINNSIIYFKFKKGNTGEWEDIPELGL